MEKITSEAQFQELRSAGNGYIYNDFFGQDAGGKLNNILHAASCPALDKAKFIANFDKYHDLDLQGAIDWLIDNRGKKWKVCGICKLCPPS